MFTDVQPMGSFVDDIPSSRRDGLEMTFNSFKEQLEQTEKKAKFILTCGTNQ